MKKCTRIEIIIEQSQQATMEKLLAHLDVNAYTFIADAGGRGDRGHRRADELTGASSNCIFLIAVEEQTKTDSIIEGVRPLLTRFGGLCVITEGFLLTH